MLRLHLHFGELADAFCPERLTVLHKYIHTLMAVVAMQGAGQHVRNSLGFSILPKDTLTYTHGEWNQRPSDAGSTPESQSPRWLKVSG